MSEVLYTAQVPSGLAASPVVTLVPATAEATPAVRKLRERFPQAIQEVSEFRGDYTVTIRPQDRLPRVSFLRDGPATVYHLYSMAHNERLRLRVPLAGGDNPSVPSLTAVWPAANLCEREVYDLMGIRFEGHPDMRRLLLPFDWPNHPLRKDVPRGGEEVPYSMTWEDEEFASFGKQILESKSYPWAPPKQADANQHMLVNMGPQHPATHGVLRLLVELDGERIVAIYPDIGYLHSGFERQGESIR